MSMTGISNSYNNYVTQGFQIKEDTDMSMNVSSNYNPASVGGQYFRNGNDKKQLDAIKQSGK